MSKLFPKKMLSTMMVLVVFILFSARALAIGGGENVNSIEERESKFGEVAFADVAPSDWYYDAVQWAIKTGITNGTTPTTFAPNATCTRGQILTFLWRAYGEPVPNCSNPFRDVTADDYYYNVALWACEQGMVSGAVFNADDACTRSMTVMFIWQAAGRPDAPFAPSFRDVPVGSNYARAVTWATDTGVTNGTGTTTFSPDDTCTRGEIVTFLYRALA